MANRELSLPAIPSKNPTSYIKLAPPTQILPSQEDTLKLVERIVNTGITALTVHCRTRNMREKDKATIERLREIVDFVESMGKGIAVIENGDCLSAEDAKRVRDITGAHSVMIARGAEANPSCFSPTPLVDVEQTLVPAYLRLAQYLDNHFSLTKFCVAQFKGAHSKSTRLDERRVRDIIVAARSYEAVKEIAGEWTGAQELQEIARIIDARPPREYNVAEEPAKTETTVTPTGTQNPEPPGSGAPLISDSPRKTIPALVSGQDPPTPTLAGGISVAVM